MMTRINLAALALAGATLIGATLTQPAAGQPSVCGPRDRIVAGLERDYGETRAFWGMHGQALVEYFRSEETRTWTMLITQPSGRACLATSGTDFEAEPIPLLGSGA